MAAVMSQLSSKSPPPTQSTTSNQNTHSLPPIVTNSPARLQRVSSYAKNRLSTYSISSNNQGRSRPQSTVFPIFHSSLPYSLVRDFAYGPVHPLFYGPLPENPSEISTPASEANRRLSDPPLPWDTTRGGRSVTSWEPGERLPQTSFDNGQDGPPWSEDEDIHSPVVTSSRHKKHKSNLVDFDRTGSLRSLDERSIRASYTGANGDGSQIYYVGDIDQTANGTADDYITYPAGDLDESLDSASARRDSHFASTLPRRTYTDASEDEDMSDTSSTDDIRNESRFSRDYQFTIADPAEEMHGKAVALFDFERENDNELPLVEGQVILVSYRHGQGWLVAQDPKTGESGLVPEEYVRLLRDIEGGWNGLMNGQGSSSDALMSPVSAGPEVRTPTQAEHGRDDGSGSGAFYTPVVSTFSTRSKDFHPYPQHLLGSQLNTPIATGEGQFKRSQEEGTDQDLKPEEKNEEEATADQQT